MTYFNNAADSFPKLACVQDFLSNQTYLLSGRECSCQTDKSKMVTERFRKLLSDYLNLPDNYKVTITHSATEASNLVIQSLYKKSMPCHYAVFDHGCHNSVIRPLYELFGESRVKIHMNCFRTPDSFDSDSMFSCCGQHPSNCRLFAISYQSNVTGTVLNNPKDIIEYLEFNKMDNCALILDITQAIGNVKIDVKDILSKYPNFNRLYLFGTTHKALGSINGTGFLIHPEKNDLVPLIYGGTGIGDNTQPREYPHYLESGTYDILSIACGASAIENSQSFMDQYKLAKKQLVEHFIKKFDENITGESLKNLKRQTLCLNPESGIINLLPVNDKFGEEVAIGLFRSGYVTRFGCHCCSKYEYTQDGTKYHQTIRVSFNPVNTISDVDGFISVLVDVLFNVAINLKRD